MAEVRKGAGESPQIRELFIEDLAEVQGGGPEDLWKKVRDQLTTTHGCCEEFPTSCC